MIARHCVVSSLLKFVVVVVVLGVVVVTAICADAREVCVADTSGRGSIVYNSANFVISGNTSPSFPHNASAGVDINILLPPTSSCPIGVVHIHRHLCGTTLEADALLKLSVQYPFGSFGHFDDACVRMKTQVSSSFCAVRHLPSTPCDTNSVPTPTPDQQIYQRHEIMGLTHFNMATFVKNGDPGCTSSNWNTGINCSNPLTFNPVKLNISNWIESYKAVGAKHAVLTAKHGCGFLLWNTSTFLPDGSEYGYAVQRNGPSFDRDVIEEFSTQLGAAGLGHGFYYSTGNNYYLNRINFAPAGPLLPGMGNVTNDQYNALVFEHVKELWERFGSLTEIWFDHGYATSQKAALIKLLQQYQPHANGFGGFGLTPNAVKWCGTESGHPSYPIWSTGCETSAGNPNSTTYCPTGGDTTLQQFDTWFWMPGVPIRPLSDMISVYHDTVGNNAVLELDFAIDRDGLVDPTHAQRYKELGDWIRSCYSTPIANTSSSEMSSDVSFTLSFPNGTSTDRFVLQEAFELGERVRAWTITVVSADTQATTTFASGSVIGYKRIVTGQPQQNLASATLTISSAAMTPIIRSFAAYKPCQ
eukprot:m.65889 g.65889  ORF g.65889 m.65889 type:complete len:586 (-) comp11539_c6_seq2:510-2267(-)